MVLASNTVAGWLAAASAALGTLLLKYCEEVLRFPVEKELSPSLGRKVVAAAAAVDKAVAPLDLPSWQGISDGID